MIDRKFLASCSAIAALALTGCPGPSGDIALEQLPSEIAAAQCGYYTRCGGVLGTLETYSLREEITDCEAQLSAFLEAGAFGTISSGIADGTIRYHSNMAAACVAFYGEATCGSSDISPTCLDVFEGTLSDGEPCSSAEQCSSTSTCDGSRAGMCPSGVCVHVPQLGESCSSTCAYGLRCASGTCQTPLAAGATCDPFEGGCGAGLSCEATEADPAIGACTAAAPGGNGEPCAYGCEAGLVCGAARTCRPPRTDGTCEVSFGAPVDECPTGEGCVAETGSTSGNCEPLPTAGEACTSICARGSRCFGSPGVCIVPIANGDPCETSTACLSGYCGSGRCASPPLCIER